MLVPDILDERCQLRKIVDRGVDVVGRDDCNGFPGLGGCISGGMKNGEEECQKEQEPELI